MGIIMDAAEEIARLKSLNAEFIAASKDAVKRIRNLCTVNAELLAALKAVEFVETNEILEGGGGNYESRCPWCGALGQNPPYWWKHKPDCPRQAAIHRAEET